MSDSLAMGVDLNLLPKLVEAGRSLLPASIIFFMENLPGKMSAFDAHKSITIVNRMLFVYSGS